MPSSINRRAIYALCALFWLALWHLASIIVGQEILLVSPLSAAERLFELAGLPAFWQTLGFSLVRIMGGFLLAFFAGTLLAAAAYRFKAAQALLAPLIGAIKSVPVASYTILCLVFMRSKNLSLVISFLMVLPVVYENLLEGLRHTDIKLLEMSRVFRVTFPRRLRMLYVPQCLPYVNSAVGVGTGIAWKSGVAAEVIGLPQGAVGTGLYVAKLNLDTRGLFAWTIAVMLVCYGLEKLVLLFVRRTARAVERM